jgi:DNA-binding PadR family transcriptional regulator
MVYDSDDPRSEIERELETLVALGLVTVTGMTEDGQWLYTITDKAREMTEDERWDAIFGYIVEVKKEEEE